MAKEVHLPNEIIQLIISFMNDVPSMCSLAKTSKSNYNSWSDIWYVSAKYIILDYISNKEVKNIYADTFENKAKSVMHLPFKDFKFCNQNKLHYYINRASEFGCNDLMSLLLLDKRSDPSSYDNYPIIISSFYGHHQIVDLLLKDKRVNPSHNNNQAIKIAIKLNHLDLVKVFASNKRTSVATRQIIDKYKYKFIKKFTNKKIDH